MAYKVEGYLLFGDNLVLDILLIAYVDMANSKLTSYYDLSRIIKAVYNNNEIYTNVNHTITTITGGRWFGRASKNIHLTELGVEFYLQMLQSYHSQKNAAEAIAKAEKSIEFAWYAIFIGIVAIVVDIIIEIVNFYYK